MVMRSSWVPDRGDFVWLNFSPHAGREQAGLRPALTLSPQAFNRKSGLALFCPVRSHAKGYSFEVVIPPGSKIEGVVLVDQVRSVDWVARRARPAGRAAQEVVAEVLAKAIALLA